MLLILAILMHAVPIAPLVTFFAIDYVATGTLVQAPYFSAMPFFVFDFSNPLIAFLPRHFMPVLPFLCIAATKRVCAYVEENHAGGRVVAHWPLSLYPAVPERAYVDSRVPGIVAGAGDRIDMLIHSSMSAERTGRLRKRLLRVGGRIGLEIDEAEIELKVVKRR